MEYLAFIVGFVVSWITIRRLGLLLPALWYHRNFMSEEKYMELYATLDNEFFFDMFKQTDTNIKKYADYLRLHQKYEEVAFERFKEQMGHVKKAAIQYTLIILLLGLVFLLNYPWYILAILLSYGIYFIYEIKIKDHGRLFNVLWILGLVLQEDKEKSKNSNSKK